MPIQNRGWFSLIAACQILIPGYPWATMQVDIELYRRDAQIAPGLRLSVIDIAPEAPARTMVFIHGFGGKASQWRNQLLAFSDTARVIAPDLRGHGQSDAPRSAYTVAEHVADLDAALTLLGVTGRIVLLGHSFGGAIVTEYALAHPERVEKLVLLATAGEFKLTGPAKALLRLPLPVLSAIHRAYAYRAMFARPHAISDMYRNAVSVWQGWSAFRSLQTPTLVIRGNRDNVFEPRYFTDVARTIPGAEEVDVGASGHMVMLERTAAVNRAIERFVAERPRGRAQTPAPETRAAPWLSFYDKDVPPTISIPPVALPDVLRATARRFPHRHAMIFGRGPLTNKISYRALDRDASRFAHLLIELGVKKGDRVLLLLPNLPQAVVAYYGTLRAGAVAVSTTPLSEPAELIRQANDSGARILVTLDRNAAAARMALDATKIERVILAHVGDYLPIWARPFARPPALDGMLRYREALGRQPATEPGVAIAPDDLALIQYTSGTTADPKGVMLSHRNLIANTLQTRHWIPDLREGHEVFLCVLPFSHVYGMTGAMNVPVAMGATMVIMPGFVTRDVLEAIKRHKPTIFPGVPTMFVAINNFPGARRYGIRSIRACISGAAPLPVEVQEAFEKLTKGRLVEGYGLTEATTVTHANPLYGRRKVGSIGIPVPGTEAKILDLASGRELPPGQIGELAVRGPQVMQGYWNDPKPREFITRDGWLLTGDVARMDADGYCEVVARKREMILAGDYQVFPRDVEEVLYEHPKVREVAVVGVQPARWPFQRVKAYVVLRAGQDASEDELIALCKRRLEEYAVPWQIEFRKELPKNFVGKVVRRLLVE